MAVLVNRMSGDLYTSIISSLVFPLHERLKGHTSVAVRRDMEDSQWWSPERLVELQIQRLRRLLQHAEQDVPYYKRMFADHGFSASQVQDPGDLKRLPFLTKELIRSNSDEIRSNRASGLARFNTGGSSGEPLVFFIGKERVSHDVAAKWRATRWWGVDIGDREIVVWGSPIELGAQDHVRVMRDALLRTRLLPAFEMSPGKLDEFLQNIISYKPKMLFGYPSALTHIARHAQAGNIQLDNLGIKVAFVTSERLYDEQREIISDVYGCSVANGYGGRDAGFIAHECPHGGMHITAEDIIVEVIDNDGNVLPAGESGELAITHLATGDFPFIRYRTGDIGVLDDRLCPCGRTLPILKEIQGRNTDFVISSDGVVMHGLALIYVMREVQGISTFKIIQESLSRTRVMMVTEEGFDSSANEIIRSGFRERLGNEVVIEIEHVDEIPAESSGKFRYVISKVACENTGGNSCQEQLNERA